MDGIIWLAERRDPPHCGCGFFDLEGEGHGQYNAATDSYYLHYFSPHQPDSELGRMRRLRREIYAMLRFWLDKGVDGFRMDAITFISVADTSWPVITAETLKEKYDNDWGNYYATGPGLHEYLSELHAAVLEGRDAVIIEESSGISAERAPDFVGADRKELDMIYQFEWASSVDICPVSSRRLTRRDGRSGSLRKCIRSGMLHWMAQAGTR